MSDLDTRALVERAQAGDTAAYGEIYRRYHHKTYIYVLRRVTHRETAEDITQEVFLRAYRNLASFTWRQDIGAWFTTIARNMVVDHFKSSHNRLTYAVGEQYELDRADGDRRVDPPTVAVVSESTSDMDKALAGLAAAQRRCLALRFGAGLPVEDTARALGINVGAVKSLQYRAMGALRRSPHLAHLGGELR